MGLTKLIEELAEILEKAREVSFNNEDDSALIAVYCHHTKTDPAELSPYMEKLAEISNNSETDTAILACYAHYVMTHGKRKE